MTDIDRLVGFYSPLPLEAATPESQLNPDAAGNPQTIAHLAELGIGTVFIEPHGFGGLNTAEPFARGKLAKADSLSVRYIEDVELPLGPNGIAAIRARCHLTPEVSTHVPVINQVNVRAIGASKWQQQQLFGEYMPPAVFLAPHEDLTPERITDIRGREVVVKGDDGRASLNTMLVERDDDTFLTIAQNKARHGKPNNGLLVQEYDPEMAWPSLKALYKDDTRRVEAMREAQLRLYSFITKESRGVAPAVILPAQLGLCRLVMIDPESVPQEAFDLGQLVTDRLMEITEAPGMLAAVDLYYSRTRQIRLREVNLRDPGLVGNISTPGKTPHLQLHAQQMASLAALSALSGARP